MNYCILESGFIDGACDIYISVIMHEQVKSTCVSKIFYQGFEEN